MYGLILPIGGHGDGFDLAVDVKFHAVDAHEPGIAVRNSGVVAVVDDEPKILLRDV